MISILLAPLSLNIVIKKYEYFHEFCASPDSYLTGSEYYSDWLISYREFGFEGFNLSGFNYLSRSVNGSYIKGGVFTKYKPLIMENKWNMRKELYPLKRLFL